MAASDNGDFAMAETYDTQALPPSTPSASLISTTLPMADPHLLVFDAVGVAWLAGADNSRADPDRYSDCLRYLDRGDCLGDLPCCARLHAVQGKQGDSRDVSLTARCHTPTAPGGRAVAARAMHSGD